MNTPTPVVGTLYDTFSPWPLFFIGELHQRWHFASSRSDYNYLLDMGDELQYPSLSTYFRTIDKLDWERFPPQTIEPLHEEKQCVEKVFIPYLATFPRKKLQVVTCLCRAKFVIDEIEYYPNAKKHIPCPRCNGFTHTNHRTVNRNRRYILPRR